MIYFRRLHHPGGETGSIKLLRKQTVTLIKPVECNVTLIKPLKKEISNLLNAVTRLRHSKHTRISNSI